MKQEYAFHLRKTVYRSETRTNIQILSLNDDQKEN